MFRPLFAVVLAPALVAAEIPAAGLNRFSSALYERLASRGDRNLVLSPYSVASALSMALAGGRGQTAQEIAKVLGQPADSPAYHAGFAAMAAAIAKSGNSGENVFLDANRVWAQRDFEILPEFRERLTDTYRAPVATVDFMRGAEAARREIN